MSRAFDVLLPGLIPTRKVEVFPGYPSFPPTVMHFVNAVNIFHLPQIEMRRDCRKIEHFQHNPYKTLYLNLFDFLLLAGQWQANVHIARSVLASIIPGVDLNDFLVL